MRDSCADPDQPAPNLGGQRTRFRSDAGAFPTRHARPATPRSVLGIGAIRQSDRKYDIRIKEPYGPTHGVAHTLDTHGAGNGVVRVMLEIRSDLIAGAATLANMARHRAGRVGHLPAPGIAHGSG